MRTRICLSAGYLALIFLLTGCDSKTTEQKANSLNQEALELFKKGQYPEAISKFTNSIELKPNDTEILFTAHFNRGQAHSRLNQHINAIEDYSKVIELKAGFSEAFYHRSIAYFHAQNYKLSLDDYLKATSSGFNSGFPEEIKNGLRDFCIEMGDEALRQEQYQAAIESYKKLEAIDRSLFTKAIKLKCARALQAVGTKHLDAKEYVEAIAKFKEADGLAPSAGYKVAVSNALVALARQEESKDYPSAVSHYEEALMYSPQRGIEINHRLSNVLIALGRQEYKRQNYEAAVDHYGKALAYSPEKRAEIISPFLNALIALAQHEEKNEEYQLALEHYREVLRVEPEMDSSILQRIQRLEVLRAAQIFATVESLKQLNEAAERFLKLGKYASSAEIESSIRELQTFTVSLKAEPNAWFFLGMAKALREVKAKERSTWHSWDFQGDGRKELEKAISLKQTFAEAHLWLGAVIAREGIESIWSEDEKLRYSISLLYQLWRNGWSNNWQSADSVTGLPYSLKTYLDEANREWQQAIELDYRMREVFREVVIKIFADLETN
jgi:tetratricopeptide (TPR) repeat protein